MVPAKAGRRPRCSPIWGGEERQQLCDPLPDRGGYPRFWGTRPAEGQGTAQTDPRVCCARTPDTGHWPGRPTPPARAAPCPIKGMTTGLRRARCRRPRRSSEAGGWPGGWAPMGTTPADEVSEAGLPGRRICQGRPAGSPQVGGGCSRTFVLLAHLLVGLDEVLLVGRRRGGHGGGGLGTRGALPR